MACSSVTGGWRGEPAVLPAPRDGTSAGRARAGGRASGRVLLRAARREASGRGSRGCRTSLVSPSNSGGRVAREWTGSSGLCQVGGRDGRRLRSRRDLVLAGSPAGALAWDHDTLQEQLATPDAPGLTTFQGAGQALPADRAVLAQGFRLLDVCRGLGEPQLGVVAAARQLLLIDPVAHASDDRAVEDADTHLSHLPCDLFSRGGSSLSGKQKDRGSRVSGSAAWRLPS